MRTEENDITVRLDNCKPGDVVYELPMHDDPPSLWIVIAIDRCDTCIVETTKKYPSDVPVFVVDSDAIVFIDKSTFVKVAKDTSLRYSR